MRNISSCRPWQRRLAAGLLGLVCASTAAADDRTALKVCADPNYPPFSTQQLDGIENKLAEILAADIGIPVAYTWFPNRIGFIRNTLRAEDPGGKGFKCDVAMNVPEDYELTITTKPYYTSTYALLYVKGRKLDDVTKPKDLVELDAARKQGLKVGLNERDPGSMWLARYDMYDQMHAYQAQTGDLENYPGREITDDLLAGNIDAAILWGPLAGLAKRRGREQGLDVVLLPLLDPPPGIRFHFSVALGTRHADGDWRDELDALLTKNKAKIEQLLREFEVPLVTPDGSRLLPPS